MFSFLKKVFDSFSPTERYIFWLALAATVLSSVVLAGIAVNLSTKVVPAVGGDYVEGVVGQPIYVNPVLASSETDKNLIRLLFSNLHEIADKIQPDQNGRVWDVRLKENLFWSDGQKITSDDAIFTVQKIQDPDSSSPFFSDWQGVAANRVSELEMQFNLTAPYAYFGDNLKELYILPKHIFAETPAANWRLSKYNLQPVGSGPYRFDSYEIESNGFIAAYRLKANDKYFGSQPMIQNFKFNFYTDKNKLIKAFNEGAIDAAGGLETADLQEIKRSYQTISYRLPSYYAIFFNQSQNLPLQDEKVREALNLAVDRDQLVKDIFQGKAVAIGGPLIPGTPYYTEDSSVQTSASIDQANKILDGDGWQIGPSGIRQKKIKNNKIDLSLDLTVPQIQFLTQTANEIAGVWKNIGVQTNLNILPTDQIANTVIKNRNYQSLLFGNILNLNFDLFSFWHSSERFYPGLNLALYSNKQADDLIESIRQSTNENQRKDQLGKLQETIVNDHPAVFLYSPDYIYITTKDLQAANSGPIADPADRFLDAAKWYVKTARVLK